MASSSLRSPPTSRVTFKLRTSALGTSKAVNISNSPSTKVVLLRPSQLAVGSTESEPLPSRKAPSPLHPPVLKNPFANANLNEDCRSQNNRSSSSNSDCDPQSAGNSSSGLSTSILELKFTDSDGKNIKPTAPRFMPLGLVATQQKDDNSTANTVSSSVTGFVFGQNLHERVAEAATLESADSIKNKSPDKSSSSAVSSSSDILSTTNGSSELLFTSGMRNDNNGCDSVAEKPKTLSEAAREYEEARSFKRKYDQVTVVTGEEDEVNVMQMNCKLFAFDKASGSWLERGRGTLRLNDKESAGDVQSRVVMRTMGSLRVVLNTKIWAGMSVDRLSPKSVRLTAMDATGQVKVFLVTATPKEAEQLHKSLETRVASQCSRQSTQVAATEGDLSSTSLPAEGSPKQRKVAGFGGFWG